MKAIVRMKKAKKTKELKSKKRLKIHHNKKLFWVIIILLIILVLLLYYIKYLQRQIIEDSEEDCFVDEDCVPKECCHPELCVSMEEADICEGTMCTAVCSGPLDCGAGHCGCVKGKCEIITDK